MAGARHGAHAARSHPHRAGPRSGTSGPSAVVRRRAHVTSLVIDASTYRGSVAVLRAGSVLSAGERAMRGADSEALMPAVVLALDAAGVAIGELDRVVCGGGPGSFTSLRIAA